MNPFYDPPHQVLIGVSVIYLTALKYLVDISESTPIVNFKGEVREVVKFEHR
jgi:hypothetical protein